MNASVHSALQDSHVNFTSDQRQLEAQAIDCALSEHPALHFNFCHNVSTFQQGKIVTWKGVFYLTFLLTIFLLICSCILKYKILFNIVIVC
jgi:hypothetical protein